MRAMGGAAAGQLGFVRGFTRYQWLVFFVVWAGWSLDATDFGLFSLVLRPALTELLGGQPTIAEIGRVGGLLSTVGLLGWAFGGFLFGIVATAILDRLLHHSHVITIRGDSYRLKEKRRSGLLQKQAAPDAKPEKKS